MINSPLREIQAKLRQKLGNSFEPDSALVVSGGNINHCYRVTITNKPFFLKTNTVSRYPLLKAEEHSLTHILNSSTLLCPRPILCGQTTNTSFLLMQYLDLEWNLQKEFLLGEKLATMHRVTSDTYGWHRDNFIGLTTQPNRHRKQWYMFWLENRLKPQSMLAKANHCPSATLRLIKRTEEHSRDILQKHQPTPSLLHGDLWQGNASFSKNGEAIIFDPASYYGDRETDIAMTELFGGFSKDFYKGYNKQWALPEGYETRREIYQLYHVINHFNLFGSPYDEHAASLCKRILKAKP